MSSRRCFVTALLLALCVAAPASAVTITVQQSTFQLSPGQFVNIDLVASQLGSGAAPTIGSWDLDFDFDPTVLGLVPNSISFGTGLGSTCSFPPSAGCEAIVQSAVLSGTVQLGAAALDLAATELTQPGSFVLASFQLVALGAGSTGLDFGVLALGDATAAPLSATANPGFIDVVPEPGSSWLLLAVALAARRHHRR